MLGEQGQISRLQLESSRREPLTPILSAERPAPSDKLPALILHLQRLGIQASYEAERHLVLLNSKNGMAVCRPSNFAMLPSYGLSPQPAMSPDGRLAIRGFPVLFWSPHYSS